MTSPHEHYKHGSIIGEKIEKLAEGLLLDHIGQVVYGLPEDEPLTGESKNKKASISTTAGSLGIKLETAMEGPEPFEGAGILEVTEIDIKRDSRRRELVKGVDAVRYYINGPHGPSSHKATYNVKRGEDGYISTRKDLGPWAVARCVKKSIFLTTFRPAR